MDSEKLLATELSDGIAIYNIRGTERLPTKRMRGVRAAFRRAMVACILNVVVGFEKLDWLDLKFQAVCGTTGRMIWIGKKRIMVFTADGQETLTRDD
jgi:hypothetical protein